MVGNEHPNQIERATAEQLGVSDSVRFCGPQTDVRKFLWAADILVIPSLYEGFSIAAIEGLGTGIKCVFADSPGLNDLKSFPFEIHWSGTDPRSLAEKILLLIGDTQLRERNVESAAQVRPEFGVERRAGEYLRLWEEGVGERVKGEG